MNKKPESTIRNASFMGLATLFSRIFGLMREQVFAFFFGATHAADAFNIAFRLPNLLRDLFAEGAMSAAFVPEFTRAEKNSKEEALRLLASVLWVLLFLVGALSILGMVFSKELVLLYAGSYQGIEGKVELTASLARQMFPFFPMVACAAVLMGALNALGAYFLPAFAPVLFNFFSIITALICVPLLQKFSSMPPIYAMAWGVVLGGFFQFYLQWWQIRKEGLTYALLLESLKKPSSGTKTVLKLLVPGTIGLAATQLGILINSIFATQAGSGAVSWLNYAFRLMQFPIGIFGVSLASATLPLVSRKLVENKREEAGVEIQNSVRFCFAVNFPAMAGLMGIGLPLVQILFQRGKFGYEDALSTSWAVFWYAVGLPGYSLVKILVPVFYALHETRIPVLFSFFMVFVNAVLNYVSLSIFHFPFWSLALATSLTSTLNALFLFWILTRRFSTLSLKNFFFSTIQFLFLSIGIFGVCRGVVFLVDLGTVAMGPEGAWRWVIKIAISIVFSLIFWLGWGKLFKVAEIEKVQSLLLRKLKVNTGKVKS